jgi:hypothetical protein
MLVYGDHPRAVDAAAEARALVSARREVDALPPGLPRHSALVSLLIRVGEWAQGVLDAEHARSGEDSDTLLARACEAALLVLGRAVAASWRDGFRADLTSVGPVLEALEALAPPEPVMCKVPEGYAFYALYPEAYVEAAERARLGLEAYGDAAERSRRDPESSLEAAERERFGPDASVEAAQRSRLDPESPVDAAKRARLDPESSVEAEERARLDGGRPWRVIGIRGIGTGLAGVVAAGLGTEALCTLRPGGHPYARTLSLSPGLTARLEEEARAGWRFAVVDEGPGLSGSSFGAVADFLEAHGAAPESVTFFPSHAGAPGPQAHPRHRERWARADVRTADFDALLLHPSEPSHSLVQWVADLTGPAEAPPEDVGSGGWRRHLLSGLPAEEWPAAHPWQERRKYLLRAGGRRWLLKFAGLGAHGARAYLHTRVLAEAGFGAPVAGLRHGFLVQPWLEEAKPLSVAWREVDRWSVLERVGEYLGFRSRHFGTVGDDCGASVRQLWEMARYNTEAALGHQVASALDAWVPRLGGLARAVRRTVTDNRLHAWEWLVLPGGRVLKADAVDHHRGHDLVGCQDLAWDVAGAAVELSLDADGVGALCAAVERHKGHVPPPDVLRFHRHAYLAFQLGHHMLAATSYDASAPDEAARLRRAADHYAELLRTELLGFRASTPRR